MPEDPRILTRERLTTGLHSLMDANNPAPESTLLSIDDHDLAQRERITTLEADNRRLREALTGNSGEMETAIRRIHDRERANGSAA